MADAWKPVLVAIGILLLVGLVLPIMLSEFVEDEQPTGITADVVSLIESGQNVTIPVPLAPDVQFNFNFFSIFGDSIQNFMVSQVIAISFIPAIILVPLIIMFIFSVVWIIKVVLP